MPSSYITRFLAKLESRFPNGVFVSAGQSFLQLPRKLVTASVGPETPLQNDRSHLKYLRYVSRTIAATGRVIGFGSRRSINRCRGPARIITVSM